jgi:hypothetical protein
MICILDWFFFFRKLYSSTSLFPQNNVNSFVCFYHRRAIKVVQLEAKHAPPKDDAQMAADAIKQKPFGVPDNERVTKDFFSRY